MKIGNTLILGFNLFSIYSLNTLLSFLFPAVTREFLLTPILLGLLTASYGWAYAALQVPAGVISDRYEPRVVITGSLGLFFLASLAFAASPNSTFLIITRTAMGVAASFVYVVALKTIELYHDPRDRGKSIGIITSLAFAGIPFSNLIASVLLQTPSTSWRTIYLVTDVPALVAALSSLLFLPRKLVGAAARSGVSADQQRSRISESTIKKILTISKSGPFWIQSAISFAYFGTLVGFVFWLPSYFEQTSLGLAFGGLAVSLIGIGNVVGLAFGGWIVDKLGKNKLVLIIFISIDFMATLALSIIPATSFFAPLILCLSFILGSTFGGSTAGVRLIAVLFPKGMVGTAYGLYNSIAWLGSAVYPFAIGLALSLGFSFREAFIPLFLSMLVILILSFFSFEPAGAPNEFVGSRPDKSSKLTR